MEASPSGPGEAPTPAATGGGLETAAPLEAASVLLGRGHVVVCALLGDLRAAAGQRTGGEVLRAQRDDWYEKEGEPPACSHECVRCRGAADCRT